MFGWLRSKPDIGITVLERATTITLKQLGDGLWEANIQRNVGDRDWPVFETYRLRHFDHDVCAGFIKNITGRELSCK